jgi:hypothetical protein
MQIICKLTYTKNTGINTIFKKQIPFFEILNKKTLLCFMEKRKAEYLLPRKMNLKLKTIQL